MTIPTYLSFFIFAFESFSISSSQSKTGAESEDFAVIVMHFKFSDRPSLFFRSTDPHVFTTFYDDLQATPASVLER